MKKITPLVILLFCSLITYGQNPENVSGLTIAQGDRNLYLDELHNILINANDKFSISGTGGIVNQPRLFDSDYDAGYELPFQATETLTIDLSSGIQGYGANGLVYCEGKVFVSFYYNRSPEAITGRWKDRNGVYRTITFSSISGAWPTYSGSIAGVYNTEIEITITSRTSDPTRVTEVVYVPTRQRTQSIRTLPIFTKANNNVYFHKLGFGINPFEALHLGAGKNIRVADLADSDFLGANNNGVIEARTQDSYNLSGFNNDLSFLEGQNLTENFVPKFSQGNLVNSLIYDNGIRVGIGTGSPASKLDVKGAILTQNGGNYSALTGTQFLMGYRHSSSNSYKHAIRTRHNGTQNDGNAIDFYVWDQGVDGITDEPTKLVLTIDGADNGRVGIGTTTPDEKLAVNGTVHSKEVRVDLTGWSDFVFEKDYDLPTLQEVETHIKEKGHLENIPSAKEVETDGIKLGEMNARLLQKIEELTLYTIEQEKMIGAQAEEIKELRQTSKKLEQQSTKIDRQEITILSQAKEIDALHANYIDLLKRIDKIEGK